MEMEVIRLVENRRQGRRVQVSKVKKREVVR